MNYVIKFINAIVNFFITFVNGLINILPDSPIDKIKININNTFLSYMNWLIPINEILQLFGIFVGVYLAYLAIAFILRFFKVIK